jgi:hypothetical protein
MKSLTTLVLILAAAGCNKSKPKEGIDPGVPEQGSALVGSATGSGSPRSRRFRPTRPPPTSRSRSRTRSPRRIAATTIGASMPAASRARC